VFFPIPNDVVTITVGFCDVVPTTDDEDGVDVVSKFTFLDISKT